LRIRDLFVGAGDLDTVGFAGLWADLRRPLPRSVGMGRRDELAGAGAHSIPDNLVALFGAMRAWHCSAHDA
jgi:hypothetical protein